MIKLLDSPPGQALSDVTLWVRRAPILLRVVIGPRGAIDALDQLEDVAADNERIVVYQLAAYRGAVHICARGKGGKGLRGMWPNADYRVMDPQPGDAHTRDNAAWAAWCDANETRIRAELADAGVIKKEAKCST